MLSPIPTALKSETVARKRIHYVCYGLATVKQTCHPTSTTLFADAGAQASITLGEKQNAARGAVLCPTVVLQAVRKI